MLYLFTDRYRKYINVPHFLMYSLSGEIDFKKYSLRATRSQSSPSWRNSSLLQPEVSSRSCLAIATLHLLSPTIVNVSLRVKAVCRAKWRTTSRGTRTRGSSPSTESRCSGRWRNKTQGKSERCIRHFTRLACKSEERKDCQRT